MNNELREHFENLYDDSDNAFESYNGAFWDKAHAEEALTYAVRNRNIRPLIRYSLLWVTSSIDMTRAIIWRNKIERQFKDAEKGIIW